MDDREIIWLPSVRKKIVQYRSEYFTQEETLRFIVKVTLEIENILKNSIISGAYTEEKGEYKGVSRIVVKKFRVYFEWQDGKILVIAILFPGEK